jgi:hypothetical protein
LGYAPQPTVRVATVATKPRFRKNILISPYMEKVSQKGLLSPLSPPSLMPSVFQSFFLRLYGYAEEQPFPFAPLAPIYPVALH